MNRNSERAKRFVRALRRLGLDVDGRRLERWCADGLGASLELSFSDQVAHYAQLAQISTSGRDVDVTARRLAAWGYPTDRYLGAVLRGLGAETPGALGDVPRLDLSTGSEADSNFSFVEQLAAAMMSEVVDLPPLIAKAAAAMQLNAARHSSVLRETPEQVFHSFMVSTLCHLFGGEHYNLGAIAAVMNIDPRQFEDAELDEVNGIKFDFAELDEYVHRAPVADFVVAAQFVRMYGPELLAHLGIGGIEPAELEDLAGAFAPLVAWTFIVLRRNFSDFPVELPSMVSLPQLVEAS